MGGGYCRTPSYPPYLIPPNLDYLLCNNKEDHATAHLGSVTTDLDGSCFDRTTMTCESTFYDMVELAPLLRFLSITFLFIPVVLVVLLNCFMLVISQKNLAGHEINLRALKTVFCICGLFILSILPYNIAIFMRSQSVSQGNGGKISMGYSLFYHYAYILNSAGNPILYTNTNRKFRRLVLKCLGVRWVCWRGAHADNQIRAVSHSNNSEKATKHHPPTKQHEESLKEGEDNGVQKGVKLDKHVTCNFSNIS
eukprot:sb/3468700/